jgi:hypothetical protein
MEQGWVKLYRKIEDNDFLMYDNTAFIVFTKLLLFADRKKGYYRAATRTLADRVNLPHSTTYKALKRLEAHGLIQMEQYKLFSKFHISNWTVYQANHEIDTILEHNAVQIGKQPKTQKQQGKTASKETVGETQGKRRRNADETYNKKEELRIKNNISTNVDILREHKEQISKLYYEAIKALDVPKRNNNHIRSRITEMAEAPDKQKVINYLMFLRDQYTTTDWAYKPDISTALDICDKRAAVKNTFERAIKQQNKRKVFRI